MALGDIRGTIRHGKGLGRLFVVGSRRRPMQQKKRYSRNRARAELGREINLISVVVVCFQKIKGCEHRGNSNPQRRIGNMLSRADPEQLSRRIMTRK